MELHDKEIHAESSCKSPKEMSCSNFNTFNQKKQLHDKNWKPGAIEHGRWR